MKPGSPPLLALLLALTPLAGAVESAPAARASRADEASPLAIERALSDLGSGDWVLQWAAMSQLARWKTKEAVPPVKAILVGKAHPWVRGRALVALAHLLGKDVLGDATTFARHSAAELRAAAVEALGILALPEGDAAIAGLLKDPVPQVRHQALVALARVRREKAWDIVAPRLADEDPAMVQHAARALVYIDTPESRDRAMALLAHDNAAVREEAAHTLRHKRVPQAIPLLLSHMAVDGEVKVRVACEKALATFDGKTLMLPMLSVLRAVRRDYYAAAVKVLSLRPTAEACEGVAALIRKPDEAYRDVVSHALTMLGRADPTRYQSIFVDYLANDNPYARRTAIQCLALCEDADLYRLLRPLLNDRDHSTRVTAFSVIRKATEEPPPEGIVRYLTDAFKLTDSWTRRATLDLMSERLKPDEIPSAIDLLSGLLGGKDKTMRVYAAKALARAGDDDARRRVASAQGYLTHWMLIGPFPHQNRNKGFGPAYFPEHEIDFHKTYEARSLDESATFKIADASCGGTARKSLHLFPPTRRRTPASILIRFALELPKGDDLKLTLFAGIQDNAPETNGVRLDVRLDGAILVQHKVAKAGDWQPVEADLAPYAGKKVAIDLAVDPLDDPKGDQAVVGEPTLVAGGKPLLGLIELAEAAPVWTAEAEKQPQVAWKLHQVNRIDGEVPLYDIFPPPIYDKVAYGMADVVSPKEQAAKLWMTADDGFILWLNATRVGERTSTGEHREKVTLRQGANRFFIKIFNRREWWRYRIRLTDPEDNAIDFLRNGAQ